MTRIVNDTRRARDPISCDCDRGRGGEVVWRELESLLRGGNFNFTAGEHESCWKLTPLPLPFPGTVLNDANDAHVKKMSLFVVHLEGRGRRDFRRLVVIHSSC